MDTDEDYDYTRDIEISISALEYILKTETQNEKEIQQAIKIIKKMKWEEISTNRELCNILLHALKKLQTDYKEQSSIAIYGYINAMLNDITFWLKTPQDC